MQDYTRNEYSIRKISPEDNAQIAKIIRANLEAHSLNISGTAYFDSCLDDLYSFYKSKDCGGYFVLVDKNNMVVGGIGFDKIDFFPNCAELQKMYIADSAKGNGLSYMLIRFIEERMKDSGIKTAYLETHSNLQAAIHVYEKSGYYKIERPDEVGHGAMDLFYKKEL